MSYFLMNKNIIVAEINMTADCSAITQVVSSFDSKYLPLGVEVNGILHTENLNKWFRGRSIPASRDNIKIGLENLGFDYNDSPDLLIKNCFALSLSDQYWIKPKKSNLNWNDFNFFQNDFSEDVGTATFDNKLVNKPDLTSPDNTSDGMLKKKWKIINGKRCLLKSGSGTTQQELIENSSFLYYTTPMECIYTSCFLIASIFGCIRTFA